MAKTIAIEGLESINDEVHPDFIEIRDAVDDREHCYLYYGEEIVCPVCRTVWLQEMEGDFTSGTCEHLRFTLHSECGDDFEYFGEWDAEGFIRLLEDARKKDKDDERDILDILGEIRHPDLDKAILYIWYDDPSCHPWMVWRYNKICGFQ